MAHPSYSYLKGRHWRKKSLRYTEQELEYQQFLKENNRIKIQYKIELGIANQVVYVIYEFLFSLKHSNNWGYKLWKQRAANFCWLQYSLLESVDVIEVKTTDPHSSFDLSKVKMYKHSSDENQNITLQTRSTN
jgi:hypothetical protein